MMKLLIDSDTAVQYGANSVSSSVPHKMLQAFDQVTFLSPEILLFQSVSYLLPCQTKFL